MEENDDYENFATEEFIRNPSKFSKHTINIAKLAAKKYNYLIRQETFLQKIKKGIKIRLIYLESYKETIQFLKNFEIKTESIETLYKSFEELADKIALNNITLAYCLAVEKEQIPVVITKEDEKMVSLKDFKDNKISREMFNSKFGHHAINPFEVSSKRFSEFSNEKLLMIAESIPMQDLNKKKNLDEYVKKNIKEKLPIYNALREELKDKGIKIIANIREKLLSIQEKNKIKDIFSMSFEEVIKYEKN